MQKSNFGKVDGKDVIKTFIVGLLTMIIGVIATEISNLYEAGELVSLSDISWKDLLKAVGLAAVAYFGKNIGSNSKDEFLTKERK